jgi:hypothetical protein
MPDPNQTLGDQPIQSAYLREMKAFAEALDITLNGEPGPGRQRKTGFVILVFPLEDHDGRCNYISNAKRDDVLILLKEQVARFEGRHGEPGHG